MSKNNQNLDRYFYINFFVPHVLYFYINYSILYQNIKKEYAKNFVVLLIYMSVTVKHDVQRTRCTDSQEIYWTTLLQYFYKQKSLKGRIGKGKKKRF